MTNTTTHATEPARHPFDIAGLGKPPYTFLGHRHETFQAYPGAPVQVGGSCDYCGQGIVDQFHVESSDGKRFKVGCDCIAKVSKSAKDFPSQRELDRAVRKHKADVRHARENAKIAEGTAYLNRADVRARLAAMPSCNEYRAANGETMLDRVEWMMAHAGATGRLDTIRMAHSLCDATDATEAR